jgi:hypothetical protein
MATRIPMSNPATGLMKDGFYGFSWTTLLFGGFPALFRADFLTFLGYFAIAFILVVVTGGIGSFLLWIIWPFMYNKYYTRRLVERGFRFAGSPEQNQRAGAAVGVSL